MKAYLSTGYRARRTIRSQAVNIANIEARAILAVTEPEGMVRRPWTYASEPVNGDGIMAESLAAILPVLDALEAKAGQ